MTQWVREGEREGMGKKGRGKGEKGEGEKGRGRKGRELIAGLCMYINTTDS